MERPAVPAAILLLALLCTGCATTLPFEPDQVRSPYRDPTTLARGEILHLPTGRLLSEGELLEHLARIPILYVGETHDSVDDHAVQLAILEGLQARIPGRLLVGIEMLPADCQGKLDAYIAGDLSPAEFREVWRAHWGDTFPYYEGILSFLREHRIPAAALNTAFAHPFPFEDSAHPDSAPGAAEQPEDIGDPYHRAVCEAFFAAHPHGSGMLEHFYRIQTLRDEAMAWHAARFLRDRGGTDPRMLILAGGNHVRYGLGIPRRLFRRVPLPYAIVLPLAVEVPPRMQDRLMDVEMPDLPMRPADFLWAVGYEDLRQAPNPP